MATSERASAARKRIASRRPPATAFTLPGAAPVLRFAQELRRWTDSVMSVAGSASDLSLNLYRGNDDARRLSDADFAQVLAFVKSAFDMATSFRLAAPAAGRGAKAKAVRQSAS